jgi:hypothetical protein
MGGITGLTLAGPVSVTPDGTVVASKLKGHCWLKPQGALDVQGYLAPNEVY